MSAILVFLFQLHGHLKLGCPLYDLRQIYSRLLPFEGGHVVHEKADQNISRFDHIDVDCAGYSKYVRRAKQGGRPI
jgi:hypothetical protein